MVEQLLLFSIIMFYNNTGYNTILFYIFYYICYNINEFYNQYYIEEKNHIYLEI